MVQETREGTIFTARAHKDEESGMILVQLFVEGLDEPIDIVELDPDDEPYRSDQHIDAAFQKWITDGLFVQTVEDPNLQEVLLQAQRERLENVPWYRRTFRFLEAAGSTHDNPRFILTADKSDLPDRYKRMLEVGEEAALQEEAERRNTERLRDQAEHERKENLRANNAQLIERIVRMAISEKAIPADSGKTLSEIGLLEPSTTFRGGARFPGETWLLRYDFTEGDKRFSGFIGFDADLKLLSVDERFPKDNQVYLGTRRE